MPREGDWPTVTDLDEMAETVAEVGCGDGYDAATWLAVIALARAEMVRREELAREPDRPIRPVNNPIKPDRLW